MLAIRVPFFFLISGNFCVVSVCHYHFWSVTVFVSGSANSLQFIQMAERLCRYFIIDICAFSIKSNQSMTSVCVPFEQLLKLARNIGFFSRTIRGYYRLLDPPHALAGGKKLTECAQLIN